MGGPPWATEDRRGTETGAGSFEAMMTKGGGWSRAGGRVGNSAPEHKTATVTGSGRKTTCEGEGSKIKNREIKTGRHSCDG